MDRDAKLEQLAALLAAHAPGPGRTPSAIEGLDLFRADAPSPIRCAIYSPCVIIVAQGRKSARVGGEIFVYSPARYLVLPVSLPIDAQILEASPKRPFLSFSVRVDPTMLAEIADAVDPGGLGPRDAVRGIAVSETTNALLDAALRLLSCLGSDAERRVLAPPIQREILFRVLTGPQGALLRGVGFRDARLAQVSRALQLIHAEYDRPMEVAELARAAHMSPSSFYDAFKAVTSHTPLQYVKEIRLTRARQVMLWEGSSAAEAARRVGYGSATQFSREFKRRFGRPPAAERDRALASGELQGARPY